MAKIEWKLIQKNFQKMCYHSFFTYTCIPVHCVVKTFNPCKIDFLVPEFLKDLIICLAQN